MCACERHIQPQQCTLGDVRVHVHVHVVCVVCMCTCTCTCTCVRVRVCVCVCVCVRMYMHVHVSHACMDACMWMWMLIFMPTHMPHAPCTCTCLEPNLSILAIGACTCNQHHITHMHAAQRRQHSVALHHTDIRRSVMSCHVIVSSRHVTWWMPMWCCDVGV